MAFDAVRYAEQFVMNLDRRTVGREITNQNYTPIEGARAVKVYSADDLSAQDKNADNSVQIQNPSGGVTTMTLDQEKDLTVGVGSVEEFQSNVDIQRKMRDRQAQAGEEDADDFILGKHTEAGIDLSTTATTADGFGDKVRDAKVALSDNDVPRSGRFMVVTPHYADLIAEDAGDRIERNRDIEVDGFIGRYQGFDIFESTGIVEASSKQHLLFGHRQAITFAVQMDDVALVPNSEQASYHGDVLKALMVYGAQTFLPNALGDLEADIPA
ncbi:hypothetical protein GGP62_002177 [Salinibacter ruber]|uniref:hypothetical protein n=1 Tax=Salinibacter ruber TaxID=146919 RepID=UPI002168D3DB|nr:hypothetical protein [Salinibacter ruber]MCS3707190.1 hypothetical protein [Salinibacter ruber]